MSIVYLGPIIATLMSGIAVYYLFVMLSESERITADNLKRREILDDQSLVP